MKNIFKIILWCALPLIFSLNEINAQELEGIHYATGKPVRIIIKDGKISQIINLKKLSDRTEFNLPTTPFIAT